MAIFCDLCHEDSYELFFRKDMEVCLSCKDGIDYYASLTPAERKAEHESETAYMRELRDRYPI